MLRDDEVRVQKWSDEKSPNTHRLGKQANGANGRGRLDRRAWRRHGGCGAPSATRAAAASHGTSDAFVIQMHFMSCLKGVFEMLMAFHQQWWMDILPIMDKLASATYPLHTYYLQFYLLLRNLWVIGILWPLTYLVATFWVLWYKDQFLRSIWLKLPKLKTDIIYVNALKTHSDVRSILFRQLYVRWKARILNSSLFWMTSPFGRMELSQLP